MMIVGADLEICRERKIGLSEDSRTANDGRLIADAHRDPAAFAKLYRRHYEAVLRYCVHRLFERQAAEDVTSAVFLRVVENFARFQGNEQQFRNWLYKIATNAVNSHLRQTARRNGLIERFRKQVSLGATDCRHTTDDSTEKLILLKQAMLTLRPRYQTIITLRFFENLKLTEIAEVLASSPGTIRSQLARALVKLRKKITSAQQEV